MFERVQYAIPRTDAKKTDLDPRMRIHKVSRDPGRQGRRRNTQLLLQFTHQRLGKAFAGFHFAAGKLPVTGIGFTWRALCQQIFGFAINLTQHHGSRYFRQLGFDLRT